MNLTFSKSRQPIILCCVSGEKPRENHCPPTCCWSNTGFHIGNNNAYFKKAGRKSKFSKFKLYYNLSLWCLYLYNDKRIVQITVFCWSVLLIFIENVVGRIMVPFKDAHGLILETCEYVISNGEGELRLTITCIWSWGNTHKDLYK